jgi:DNA mismatch repair protein MutS
VAKLAGLPASVIERAKLVLAKLEAEDRSARRGFEDLPLFAAMARAPAAAEPDPAVQAILTLLAEINPDELSPRQALEALYALKLKARKP